MPESMSLKAFADNYNEFLIQKSSSLSITEGETPEARGSAGSVMSKFSRDNPLVFTTSQRQLVEKLDQFLSDPESDIFIMKGYAGTGKSTVLCLIHDYMESLSDEWQYCLMAPTGRAAMVLNKITASRKCTTIHRGIYDTPSIRTGTGTARDFDHTFSDSATEITVNHAKRISEMSTFISQTDNNRKKLIIPVKTDFQNHCKPLLLVFDEASMIGNSYSEMSEFRFGTGMLLNDILLYSYIGQCSQHRHKIIFCGDPAQLFPVGMNFSPSLDVNFLQNDLHFKTYEFELSDVLRQSTDSGILNNATKIRNAIRNRNFSTLKIEPGSDVIELTDTVHSGKTNRVPSDIAEDSCYNPEIKDELIRIFFAACRNLVNNRAEFITFSNSEAFEINRRIRAHLHAGVPMLLEAGDKLIVTQNSYIQEELFLSNGTFVQVTDILPERFEKTFSIKMKKDSVQNEPGDSPFVRVQQISSDSDIITFNVTLKTLKVRLRKREYTGEIITFDCWILLNDLCTAGTGISGPENAALGRITQYRDNQDGGLSDEIISFKEAVRVRYGYAITCHKSQGNEWDSVFLYSLNRQTKNGSEEIFHWYYTAITRARKKLFIVDPASFGKFSNIKFSSGTGNCFTAAVPRNPSGQYDIRIQTPAPRNDNEYSHQSSITPEVMCTEQNYSGNHDLHLQVPDPAGRTQENSMVPDYVCPPAENLYDRQEMTGPFGDPEIPEPFDMNKYSETDQYCNNSGSESGDPNPQEPDMKTLLLRYGIAKPDSVIGWMALNVIAILKKAGLYLSEIKHHSYQERYIAVNPTDPKYRCSFSLYYNSKNTVKNIMPDQKCSPLPKTVYEDLVYLEGKRYMEERVNESTAVLTPNEQEIMDHFKKLGAGIDAEVSLVSRQQYALKIAILRKLHDCITDRYTDEYCEAVIYYNAKGNVTSFRIEHTNSDSLQRDLEQMLENQQ